MKEIADGIAVFENYFLRNEELIDLAETENKWRQGTAGKGTDPKVRITDIYDMDNESELGQEALEVVVKAIREYGSKYIALQITQGEHLRIARYQTGGHYAPHVDSNGDRKLSAIIYLNNDFEGGELYFPVQDVTIKPEPGMLVLFPSSWQYVHQSKEVTKGTKYTCLGWFG